METQTLNPGRESPTFQPATGGSPGQLGTVLPVMEQNLSPELFPALHPCRCWAVLPTLRPSHKAFVSATRAHVTMPGTLVVSQLATSGTKATPEHPTQSQAAATTEKGQGRADPGTQQRPRA